MIHPVGFARPCCRHLVGADDMPLTPLLSLLRRDELRQECARGEQHAYHDQPPHTFYVKLPQGGIIAVVR